MMKLLVDIDDTVIPITQSLYVNYLTKIVNEENIYCCNFSLVENGIGLEPAFSASAELAWAKAIDRVNVFPIFAQIIGNFDWHCLFRSPESDISKDENDTYIQALVDSLESSGIKPPDVTIRVPFKSEYDKEKFIQQTFDENYILITSSKYLANIARDCSHIQHIIVLTRPHNLDYCLELSKKKNDKILLAGDILSAFQTYQSIVSYFGKQEKKEESDKTEEKVEQSDAESDNN